MASPQPRTDTTAAGLVKDPYPMPVRVVLGAVYLVVAGALAYYLHLAVGQDDYKVLIAALGACGTGTQLFLALDHGSAQRRSESESAHRSRLVWRDKAEAASWALITIGLIGAVISELG